MAVSGNNAGHPLPKSSHPFLQTILNPFEVPARLPFALAGDGNAPPQLDLGTGQRHERASASLTWVASPASATAAARPAGDGCQAGAPRLTLGPRTAIEAGASLPRVV